MCSLLTPRYIAKGVVNGNRVKAGLEAYTKDEFEYLEEPPLELMQQTQSDLKIF